MRVLVTSIIAASLLGGCGTSPKNLHRANTTAEQKRTDVEYCKVYGEANAGNMSTGGLAGITEVMARRDAHFKLCMLDRGYREHAAR